MKTITLATAVLSAFVLLTLGVSAQPAQGTHENRVYINDGNTYIQKSLPLYLSFSTTTGGPQYELTRKASAAYATYYVLRT